MSPITTNPVEPDEQRLIAAAKAGDKHAYAQLLRRHQAVAFRAAYLISGSEAEDATQEACVKAWLAVGRFAGLAAAVRRLREDDQLVIAARYFLGLSEPESAIGQRIALRCLAHHRAH